MSGSETNAVDAFERDWKASLEEYDARRLKYLAALDAEPESKREAARAYWNACALVFHCYNRPDNWKGETQLFGPDGGAMPRFAFPPALAKVFGHHAQYLAAGQLPAQCSDVLGKGRTAPGPHESRDMAVAVAFVSSARAGEAAEIAAPIKFTADAYGINVRTLQKWIVDLAWVSKDDFGTPENLRAQFDKSAKNYRAAGRSASAIEARAKIRSRY